MTRVGRGLVATLLAVAPASALPQPVGDAARGRMLVADRQRGMCLLCHRAPIAEERLQGDLAPDLAGAGARWSPAQLRARIADARRFNPQTIMPPYRATEGLAQVGAASQGRPLFDEQQLEDVVAWLATLR